MAYVRTPVFWVRTHFSPELCGTNCRREQISHPDQVIGSGREREDPSNPEDATMPGLTKQSHRFEPAEYFLDALPFPHADWIAGMARCAGIDGAAAGPLLI